jgi:hypothetical protein
MRVPPQNARTAQYFEQKRVMLKKIRIELNLISVAKKMSLLL